MNITILGTGNIGAGLGLAWAKEGHDITYGVRDVTSYKNRELVEGSDNIKLATVYDAITLSHIIVLAVPFDVVREVLSEGDFREKIIIDCTNALNGLPDGFPSAAEAIAHWANCPRVVKAFNSTGSANLRDTDYDGQKIETLICGDDDEAKRTVKELAEEVGFAVIDAGKLSSAKYLEDFAKLWIHLAYHMGIGENFAFKMVSR
ncbi:MAG TPA: NAD(P)-binding domain-containing protein [Patescibacteria group bacterium]|nr:NAD(P)-binding domain-containing protein [Patescibacteria group bacterium]